MYQVVLLSFAAYPVTIWAQNDPCRRFVCALLFHLSSLITYNTHHKFNNLPTDIDATGKKFCPLIHSFGSRSSVEERITISIPPMAFAQGARGLSNMNLPYLINFRWWHVAAMVRLEFFYWNRRKDRWMDNWRHVVLVWRQTLCREPQGGEERWWFEFLCHCERLEENEKRGGFHALFWKRMCSVGSYTWRVDGCDASLRKYTLGQHNVSLTSFHLMSLGFDVHKKDRWLNEKETIDRGMFALCAGFTYNSNVVSVRINYKSIKTPCYGE